MVKRLESLVLEGSVLTSPPSLTNAGNPRFLNVSEQQNVTENTTGFILCPVNRGYPEATVRWCKNGQSISSPRINVTHEGLQIANVEPGDAGNYTCSLCRDGWGCIPVTIAVQVLSGDTGGECMQFIQLH